MTPPVRELFDFARVFCAAGDSVLVRVELAESVLAMAVRRAADHTPSIACPPNFLI